MKQQIAIIVSTGAILFPFLINVLGWNVYAYFNFGEKDLILASASGVSHNAWAEHYDDEEEVEFGVEVEDNFTTTILDVGFLNLFLERRGDPMTPFAFRLIEPDRISDYRGVEFPWLLLLLVPVIIMAVVNLKGRRDPGPEPEHGD